MTHPLTDEICDQITDKLSIFSIEDCMRSAYDRGREDQREECLKWLDKQDEGTTLIKEMYLENN